MNLLQIEYFLALSKHKSFRKTAEALYVSQPAVSKQIAQLEKEWGIKLFFRRYKDAILTPAGEIMYEMMKSADEDFHKAVIAAQRAGFSIRTQIDIGIPEYSQFGNLFDILSKFRREHEDVALNVDSTPIANLVLNRHSKFDLVISHEYNLGDMANYESTVLAKRRHIALISNDHNLVSGRESELKISDLADDTIYIPAPEENSLTIDYCKFICAHHSFAPKEVKLLPNVNSVLLAAKMCFGAAFLDDLVIVPPDYNIRTIPTDVEFNLRLAWRKENQKRYLRELTELITENLVLNP